MLSFLGAFDPIKPHRKKRVLRRHFSFLDFLRESVHSYQSWTALNPESREATLERARLRWYTEPVQALSP